MGVYKSTQTADSRKTIRFVQYIDLNQINQIWTLMLFGNCVYAREGLFTLTNGKYYVERETQFVSYCSVTSETTKTKTAASESNS